MKLLKKKKVISGKIEVKTPKVWTGLMNVIEYLFIDDDGIIFNCSNYYQIFFPANSALPNEIYHV